MTKQCRQYDTPSIHNDVFGENMCNQNGGFGNEKCTFIFICHQVNDPVKETTLKSARIGANATNYFEA
ncbi:hypothetical protein, partial [Acinetobacter baumannii]|uniref:hypothetical protein n=1 Tax=Acinetobacter baumannii TaxID=470 RepID=UPI001C06C646